MLNRLSRLLPRRAEPTPQGGRKLYFTRGSELLPYSSVTRSFEADLLRSIGSSPQALDDAVLARVFAASWAGYSAAEYRATTVSQFPLMAVNHDDADERLENTPLDYLISVSSQWMHLCTISLLIWGRFYLRKRRNARGFPTGMEWINPQRVREQYERGNIVREYQIRRDDWTYERVPVEDVVYSQAFDPNPDGRGMSKFEAALKEINVSYSLANFAGAFFVNGAHIDGIMSLPAEMSDEEFIQARNDYVSNFRGVRNAHTVMTVRAGTVTWTPISSTPKDLEMPGLSRNSVLAIYQVMGVDPALTGVEGTADPLSAGSTYSGKEIAHIRNVELPFVRSNILPALNEQWAWTDFGRKDYYTLAVDERAIPALAESQLVKSQTAGQMANDHLHDYDEARKMVGLDARGADYLKRKADEPLSVYAGGVSTLNETRRFLGLAPFERDVIVINATAVPVDRIHEVLDANVEQVKNQASAMAPFGALSAGDDLSPIGDAAEEDEPRAEDHDHSFCLALSLESNPELISLQRAVKAFCERQNIPVRWNAPDTFHITLVYAPDVAPQDAARALLAISSIPAPKLQLGIGSLRTFQSVGEYALHFRVRTNAALVQYQRALYDALRGSGLQLSSYSDPDAWTPHVTMGYADSKPEEWTIRKPVKCAPQRMVAWHGGDYQEVYEAACEYEAPVAEPVEVAEEAPLPDIVPARSVRAALPISIDAVFPGHEFVKAARRELSAFLIERGVPVAQWIDEPAWSIPLAYGQGSASDAAAVLRGCDYDTARKVDLWTNAYVQLGNRVYLSVEASDALTALRRSAALDLSLCGGKAEDDPGVLLAILDDDTAIDWEGAPTPQYPLIIARVALFLETDVQREWELSGDSQMQRKTLTNWRHKAKRSADRAASFNSERWLPPLVDAFIRLSLEDDDCAIDDVFAIADLMLTERAFADTKAAFMNAIRPLFERVVTGNMSRQAFGGGMRAQLRRFGLMAFRDGMNEVGYDPESFGDKELKAFRDWQAQQSAYVTGLSDEMFKERGVTGDEPRPLTAAQIEQRVQMWADISLEAARYAGIVVGNDKQKVRWRYNPEAQHCKSCITLNGKVFYMSELIEAGVLPGSSKLDCGPGCKCGLEIAGAKTKLSPRRLIGLAGTRRSLYDSFDEDEEDDDDVEILRHKHGDECGCETVRADERAEDCVSSKIAKLIDEGYEQDQAAAIAYSMCEDRADDYRIDLTEDSKWRVSVAAHDDDGWFALFDYDNYAIAKSRVEDERFADKTAHTNRSAPDLSPNGDTEDDDTYDADEQRAVPEKYSHIDWKPTEAMADNARRALEVRAEKPDSQKGMTAVGIARARDISNRKNLSPETVRRMKAYFDRHEVDKQGETWDEQGKGWQAWNGWGGDEGYAWSRKRVEQMNAADDKDSA